MRQVPAYLIIGQGRVARHFRHYLSLLGIPCSFWHRGEPLPQLRSRADAATHILVLIRDDAIESFIDEYLKDAAAVKIHFSGALATNRAFGAHPLMTFGPELYDLEKYKTIPFIVDEGAPEFDRLLPGLSNPHISLAGDKKAKYHALCVLGGNFSCLLWQKFFAALEKDCGIPAAFGKPYMLQQTENLAADHANALTGPLARGDRATMIRNILALSGDPYQKIYQTFVDVYSQEKETASMMTVFDFGKKKEKGEKITMVTCYDYTSAMILANTSVDCLLVGDSLAMTMHGYQNTIAANMEMMAMHTGAVARGAKNKFIVGDLPFLAYRKSLSENISATQALMQAGAHAVKLEGTSGNTELITHLTQSGVPVMGHIGLTPQFVHQLGGYRVQGRTDESAQRLTDEALALEKAGCFALVLECVPANLAADITQKLKIPTIGIGAGKETDGQVLVFQDLLGLNTEFKPRFVETFLNGAELFSRAVENYAQSVKSGEFPRREHSY